MNSYSLLHRGENRRRKFSPRPQQELMGTVSQSDNKGILFRKTIVVYCRSIVHKKIISAKERDRRGKGALSSGSLLEHSRRYLFSIIRKFFLADEHNLFHEGLQQVGRNPTCYQPNADARHDDER